VSGFIPENPLVELESRALRVFARPERSCKTPFR